MCRANMDKIPVEKNKEIYAKWINGELSMIQLATQYGCDISEIENILRNSRYNFTNNI